MIKKFPKKARHLSNHPMWKGGKVIVRGYYMLRKPNHPSCPKGGYIREHRYIMEKELKRPLEEDEIVHHINGDKLDNRIENLIVLKRKNHLIKENHPDVVEKLKKTQFKKGHIPHNKGKKGWTNNGSFGNRN